MKQATTMDREKRGADSVQRLVMLPVVISGIANAIGATLGILIGMKHEALWALMGVAMTTVLAVMLTAVLRRRHNVEVSDRAGDGARS